MLILKAKPEHKTGVPRWLTKVALKPITIGVISREVILREVTLRGLSNG